MKNSIAEFLMNRGVSASQLQAIEINGQTAFNTSYDAFCTTIYRGSELLDCIVDHHSDDEFVFDMLEMLFDMPKIHDCYMKTEEEEEIDEISDRVLGHTSTSSVGRTLISIGSTCKGCDQVNSCEFAWDPYNTDGDCLASK